MYVRLYTRIKEKGEILLLSIIRIAVATGAAVEIFLHLQKYETMSTNETMELERLVDSRSSLGRLPALRDQV